MKRYIYIMLFMMTLGCFCAGCLRQEKHGAKENVDYAVCKKENLRQCTM